MLAPELFLLHRPLSAMCNDRVDLQDCLEHGRTAKVLALYFDGTNILQQKCMRPLVKCQKHLRSFGMPCMQLWIPWFFIFLTFHSFREGFCKCILEIRLQQDKLGKQSVTVRAVILKKHYVVIDILCDLVHLWCTNKQSWLRQNVVTCWKLLLSWSKCM